MIGEKKDDDEAGSSAAVKVLDKSAVLQEVRAFNDPQIDARRCVELIGSLLRLISRGDVLTPNECQDVFFGSTKLFQCPDERLRRMVYVAPCFHSLATRLTCSPLIFAHFALRYLLIKELKPSADIVFIVTASLNKDMTGTNDTFRSNALRVMCQITDAQMLLQVERFIKQACVDKQVMPTPNFTAKFRSYVICVQAAVSSAALVSGLQLLKKNNESVKRWQNEVGATARCTKTKPFPLCLCLCPIYFVPHHAPRLISQLHHLFCLPTHTSPRCRSPKRSPTAAAQ
jgi:coatomer protein complex subunit gamma